MEPPDTIPNSEVKRCNADGSVGHPHVRVGHRQVTKYLSKLNQIKTEEPQLKDWGFCFFYRILIRIFRILRYYIYHLIFYFV